MKCSIYLLQSAKIKHQRRGRKKNSSNLAFLIRAMIFYRTDVDGSRYKIEKSQGQY